MRQRQAGANGGGGAADVAGCKAGGAGPRRRALQPFHQFAGIDAHRAARGAHAGGGAGIDGAVAEIGAQRGQLFPRVAVAVQLLDASPGDDALARAQRQPMRRAGRLAKAALDAAVDDGIGRRQGFEVFQVQPVVVGDDHAGIEQAVRIEQGLDAAHDVPGGVAPFLTHKGRDIAAGAVLGFQRAVVFAGHQRAHVLHEGVVARHLALIVEAGREHEMQIAVQRVAEQQRLVIAVAVEQGGQPGHAVGQQRNRKSHILDHHGAAQRTHRAHRREQALAQGPIAVAYRGLAAEAAGQARPETSQQTLYLRAMALQFRLGTGPRLNQQTGLVRAKRPRQKIRQPRLAVQGAQAAAVYQFHRRHAVGVRGRAQRRHRAATGLQRVEQQQSRSFVRMFHHAVEGDFADKAQRALGADQHMAEHVHRIVEIQQGVDAVAGGVLQPVFAAHALGQRLVGAQFGGQAGQAGQQRGVGLAKSRHAGGVAGVQHGAVQQQQTHRRQGVITVVAGAATHAAGVVGGNAADLGAVDRRRVRADLAAVRRQQGVGVAAYHRRPQPDARAPVQHLAVVEAVAQQDQHRIADRLAGQAGAGGAESQRHPVAARQREDGRHFRLAVDAGDDLRPQPVEAGVGAVSQRGQRIGVDARRRHDLEQIPMESLMRWTHAHGRSPPPRRASRSRTSSCRVLGAGVSGAWFWVQPS